MIKHTIVFYVFFLCSMEAFSQELQPGRTLRIDPSGAGSILASQALQEVNYIPLETTGHSLFGIISQLFITDKYFIIRDADTRCILFFFKNGKFHCKINYDNVFGIAVDRGNQEISFTRGNQICFYDFNGKKLREEPRKFLAQSRYMFSKNIIAYSSYIVDQNNPDTIGHELFLNKDNKLYQEFLPYNMKTSPIVSNDFFMPHHDLFYETGSDTSVNYCRRYDYSIYNLTTNRLNKPFSFIFPAGNSLPETFSTDTALYEKRIEYIKKHPNLIYDISDPYQIGNNLFFKTNRYNSPADSYIYNLESENLIAVKYIQPDESTCYLPVTDLNDGDEFMNRNFFTCDGSYVYTSLSSALMFKYKDDNRLKKPPYSGIIKTYFEKGSRKDNPVIVQIKPKKNF